MNFRTFFLEGFRWLYESSKPYLLRGKRIAFFEIFRQKWIDSPWTKSHICTSRNNVLYLNMYPSWKSCNFFGGLLLLYERESEKREKNGMKHVCYALERFWSTCISNLKNIIFWMTILYILVHKKYIIALLLCKNLML